MHYLFAISPPRNPSFYYMSGAIMGCISHGVVSVILGKGVVQSIGRGPTASRPALKYIDDPKRLSGSPLAEVYGYAHDI